MNAYVLKKVLSRKESAADNMDNAPAQAAPVKINLFGKPESK